MRSSGIARPTGGDAKPWTGGHRQRLRGLSKMVNAEFERRVSWLLGLRSHVGYLCFNCLPKDSISGWRFDSTGLADGGGAWHETG